ncbi:hypothetical protein H5410_045215 [Solanum commersonii]|uniref:CCHC-type domain-containing protein n=1 Tax=Solanum commersonii TaxID=4109 RepID=A0A9J5XB16_SOLCO|nr:hypothetical protein H5410_045215 [Solanum commersonii]
MELLENGLEHWKAYFIDGLPPFFAERVKKTLRNSQGVIPYGTYTYGKLIGACTQEGDFCTQFDLPDSGKSTKHRDSSGSTPNRPHKRRKSRRRSREEREERRGHRKSHRFTKNRSRRELAKFRCYKCGKFGHIVNN